VASQVWDLAAAVVVSAVEEEALAVAAVDAGSRRRAGRKITGAPI
jgi:hypothetical protein